jgi:hypothetical protein
MTDAYRHGYNDAVGSYGVYGNYYDINTPAYTEYRNGFHDGLGALRDKHARGRLLIGAIARYYDDEGNLTGGWSSLPRHLVMRLKKLADDLTIEFL